MTLTEEQKRQVMYLQRELSFLCGDRAHGGSQHEEEIERLRREIADLQKDAQ